MYTDEHKKFVGKARITYSQPEEALNAFKAMNKKVLSNSEIVVLLLS